MSAAVQVVLMAWVGLRRSDVRVPGFERGADLTNPRSGPSGNRLSTGCRGGDPVDGRPEMRVLAADDDGADAPALADDVNCILVGDIPEDTPPHEVRCDLRPGLAPHRLQQRRARTLRRPDEFGAIAGGEEASQRRFEIMLRGASIAVHFKK